ncbi:MAG: DNA gyrase inhibitor YacG [Alphaproteobacteria bacterium]|nr:DNA gyrase inhibitor YacG [Alphaproteobacteria bacterium]
MEKRPSITSQLASIAKVCPMCGQSSHAGYAPFCSLRCSEVDLNRWNKGVYRL